VSGDARMDATEELLAAFERAYARGVTDQQIAAANRAFVTGNGGRYADAEMVSLIDSLEKVPCCVP